jgi:hypothetical protein
VDSVDNEGRELAKTAQTALLADAWSDPPRRLLEAPQLLLQVSGPSPFGGKATGCLRHKNC